MPFKNLKEFKKYQKKWREENKGYIKEHRPILSISDKKKSLARLRRWGKDNPKLLADKIRECHLKRKYGITTEEYEEIYVSQEGKCAICGQSERVKKQSTGTTHSLSVDHDHRTNKVRGLLCGNCNRAVGLFLDSESLLQKAIQYLRKYKDTNEATTPFNG